MYKLLKTEQLCENTYRFRILVPRIAAKVRAGQFLILRIDETGERVPFTVSDFDRDAGYVEIVFQTIGATTYKLAALHAGDCVADVVGPLGKATEYGAAKSVCVIGGGLGCAIAFPQAKALHAAGIAVDMVAGFRSTDYIIMEEEMRSVCRDLLLLTDDGSNNNKGLVTDGLKKLVEGGKHYDLVIAIGPVVMMKFVCLLTKDLGIRTIVSLNPIMIDGTGMCGGCRVKVGGEVRFACVDGPDFDGHLVDFDELNRRNKTYAEFEKERLEAHRCKLGIS